MSDHEIATVFVSPENYKTEIWCKCGYRTFQVNSYGDNRAQKDFLEHQASARTLRAPQQMGAFTRYTTTAHADVLKAFPELMNGGLVFVRDTYGEASADAAHSVLRTLALMRVNAPVRIYHHPHNEASEDPLDLVGSWGWKTV